jgi:MoaA/NifB/PqqE/SkfB family radical SAM enzyme
MIRDVDSFFDKVDFVVRVTILGGEPFMYGQLPALLDHICSNHRNKYGTLGILTNGTILPNLDTLQAIKRYRADVSISDYGKLSRNIDPLCSKLWETRIPFSIDDNITWRDWRRIVGEGDDGYAQSVFDVCTCNCNTVMNGKFYCCPFLAHGDALSAIPYDASNGVDLLEAGTDRTMLRNYKYLKKAPDGCRYCSGSDPSASPVAASIQVSAPLQYQRYDEAILNAVVETEDAEWN